MMCNMHDSTNDVWCVEWLIDLYQTEVVDPLMKKASILEEFDGFSLKEVEEFIWVDYEDWAEERILKAKEALAENYE